ncbi:probable calcium and integrin-binding family member 2 [Coccomyxa sp. Obi]|nr:probable calcium and integrin-binding family member 2 [Coccomyxa sp. Obi]
MFDGWFSTHSLPREELRRFVKETPFESREEMLKVDELQCNPFAARIVELFSEDGSGEINFQKFINIFSVFSPRATVETKMVWAFAIWDFDGDDLIGPRDIKRGVHLLTNADMAILNTDEDDEQPDQQNSRPRRGKRRDSAALRGEKLTEEQITQIHERIAQEIDPEGAGLSYSDFNSIASRMPDFFFNFRMSV